MNQFDNLSWNEFRANTFFKNCDLQTENQTQANNTGQAYFATVYWFRDNASGK